MYNNLDGQVVWKQRTRGLVLFGGQTGNRVYTGTSDHQVYSFSKQGEPAVGATPSPTTLEATTDASQGVMLECFRERGAITHARAFRQLQFKPVGTVPTKHA